MRKPWIITTAAFALIVGGCGVSPSQETHETAQTAVKDDTTGKLWVTGERLSRHTCPSTSCGVVGQLFFREGVVPMEEKDGWVRVSKIYDASCNGGRSEYVDEGNAACEAANGITDGRFAEWVRKDGLSPERPANPADTATADESLIADSDDFGRYRTSFAKIASRLIAEGRCTADEFKEEGGFMKSVNNYRNEPVYFVYCGGVTAADKVYVNAETGETVN